MAQPFFAASNSLANTVFDVPVGFNNAREFEMTVPLNPQVSSQAILDKLFRDRTALWLDGECVLVPVDTRSRLGRGFRHRRYEIDVRLMSGRYRYFALCQVPGTTERGAPLPALEFFINRVTNDDGVHSLRIYPSNHPNTHKTLDVSPAGFSKLLRTSRSHKEALTLTDISLTTEQTALLVTHDVGPIFMHLDKCRFHGPTLLQQLDSAALQRERTHHMGRGGSDLDITLDGEEIRSISKDELTALLLIPRLRAFRPFSGSGVVSYDNVKKLVSALASNEISTLDRLDLLSYGSVIEWEEEEKSAWIDIWKAIGLHPSLKEIDLTEDPGLHPQSWWQPIAKAVKVNPRLTVVHLGVVSYKSSTWKTKLAEHVEPLLESNRYRPKIAALCCTDPSTAAVLLGQAIVAIAHKKNAKCRHEIHRMLLDQLVLTGYDFGVGVGRVLGKKRPLADDTVVVVPNGIAVSTDDNNNESNI